MAVTETLTETEGPPSAGVPMPAGSTHRSVYFNGKMIPEHEARVSIFDSALMFGDMAFEMTRTYNHKAFCLREHLVRLYKSLKMMQIDPGMTIDEMEQVTLDTLAANMVTEADDVDWQIMHDVSRGTMGIYHSIGEGGDNDGGPTVSINCWPLITHQGGYAPNYSNGVNLVVSPVTQLPAHLLDLKAKTRSRLHYQMSILNSQLYEVPVDPVLMDPDGFLAEGPGWNICAFSYPPFSRSLCPTCLIFLSLSLACLTLCRGVSHRQGRHPIHTRGAQCVDWGFKAKHDPACERSRDRGGGVELG